MNLIEQQNILKSLTDEALQGEVSRPSGATPPFLIATELERRKSMRDRYEGEKARKGKTSTVLEDIMASMQAPSAAAPMGQPGMPQQAPMPAAPEQPGGIAAFAEGGLVGSGGGLDYAALADRYNTAVNARPEREDRARALALLMAGAGMMGGGSSNTLTNIGKGIGAGATYYGDALTNIDTQEREALRDAMDLEHTRNAEDLQTMEFGWRKEESALDRAMRERELASAAENRGRFSATAVTGVDENGDTVTARFNTTTGDYAPNPRPDGTTPAAFTPLSAAEIVEQREQAKKDVSRLQQLPADTAGVTDSLRQATTAMSTIKDAYNSLNWSNTGPIGAMSGALPGGGWATDARALITTLKSGLAASALQAMRDASKTGGALGNVSDKDLELLQSKIANLDPNQGEEQLKRQLAIIYDELNAALATRVSTFEQTYANTPGAKVPELALPPPTFTEFMGTPEGADPMDELVNRYATP